MKTEVSKPALTKPEVCGDQDNVQQLLEALVQTLPDQESTIMTYGQQLIQQGRQQGRQEGRQEGRHEGWQECAKETAKNLLVNGVSEAIVERATGLPEAMIQQLKKEIQH